MTCFLLRPPLVSGAKRGEPASAARMAYIARSRGNAFVAIAIVFLLVVVASLTMMYAGHPIFRQLHEVEHRRLVKEQEQNRLSKANIFDITTCEAVCDRCTKVYNRRLDSGTCDKIRDNTEDELWCDNKFEDCKAKLKQKLPGDEGCPEDFCDFEGNFVYDVEIDFTFDISFCTGDDCDTLSYNPLVDVTVRTALEDSILNILNEDGRDGYEYKTLALDVPDEGRRKLGDGGGRCRLGKGKGGNGSGGCRRNCNKPKRRRKLAIQVTHDEGSEGPVPRHIMESDPHHYANELFVSGAKEGVFAKAGVTQCILTRILTLLDFSRREDRDMRQLQKNGSKDRGRGRGRCKTCYKTVKSRIEEEVKEDVTEVEDAVLARVPLERFTACRPRKNKCKGPDSNLCCGFPGCTCLQASKSACEIGTDGMSCRLYSNGIDGENLCCRKGTEDEFLYGDCAEVCGGQKLAETG